MSITAYKGMDENMQCRGFQYEVGKEYETDSAEACKCGFHACEVPLEVFDYYDPATSRFFAVEQGGDLSREGSDSKVASTKIKIGAEIGIPGLVKAHVEYIKERLKKDDETTNTGDQSAATNTGDQSAASVFGAESVAIATGYQSKVKANLGSAIVIVERGDWNRKTYPLVAIKAAIIDGEILKPDVWYTLKNGEFTEVEDDTDM